jgi:hypothetical protein
MFYGSEYFILALMFILVFNKLFAIIKEPSIQFAFSKFGAKRDRLIKLAAIFVSTYFIRGVINLILGNYDIIAPGVMLRWELYLTITTVLEVPNLFYLYATHY